MQNIYCFATQDHALDLSQLTESDAARLLDSAQRCYQAIADKIGVCIRDTLQRQAAAAASSSSGHTKRRLAVTLVERRHATALKKQGEAELYDYCMQNRDRSVADAICDSSTDEAARGRRRGSPGDKRLEQMRADFYDGFSPHEGQIALFEMHLEMLGSRIYAEDWDRDWRAICQRNNWNNVRLRLGFGTAIMPRRTGKTTIGARAGLVDAMNIPRFKGVIIGTSIETANYTIEEMIKQSELCARLERDYVFSYRADSITIYPKNDPRDIRTWRTIPGEASLVVLFTALLCFACYTLGGEFLLCFALLACFIRVHCDTVAPSRPRYGSAPRR
jgi:hypothetical protein